MQAQRPGTILIVDADEVFLSSASSALVQCGHVVMTCRTGMEARRDLERMPYDVVLCGWKLPDEDGATLCHYIKTHAQLPYVAVGTLTDAAVDDMWIAKIFAGSAGEGNSSQDAPDELIVRAVGGQELCVRVQALLQLRRYRQEIDNALGTLMALAEGVEEQDRRARGHCKRLSIMCVELGSVMGMDEWQLTALERAAYLHDVGNVSIPGAIISKIHALTPREMEIIQGHCQLGEALCRPVAALKPVLPIIRHHHERANGTGYPDGLYGEGIPVLAQIFSIPDIYDSLRMWHPYRTSMSEAQAFQIMRQEVAQGFWNVHIFDAFVAHVLPGLDERLDSVHALWPTISPEAS
jgi:putative two-component system response regulator